MLVINKELTEDARNNIFKEVESDEMFYKIAREKDKILFYLKMPKTFEEKVLKIKKLMKTERGFLENEEKNKEQSNPLEYYQLAFIEEKYLDDINSPFILDGGSRESIINLAVLRVKGISEGLVFEIVGKMPLISSKYIEEIFNNFEKRIDEIIKILNLKINMEVVIQNEN